MRYYVYVFRLPMKNVKIEPGCISCGSCEFLAPEVFKVVVTSQVKSGVDFQAFQAKIRNAAAKCPVQVIKIEEGVPVQSSLLGPLILSLSKDEGQKEYGEKE
jgi:ferredoxin